MSPGYFAPGDHRNEIASQELPSAAICDYTLLDLPIQPNGSYDDTSYTFISSAGYRLLFNVGLQGMGLSEILSVIQKGPFLQSVQTAQISVQPSKIYGLGFLKGLPILESGVGLLNDNALLRRTYMTLFRILTNARLNEDDIRNFYALEPNVIQSRYTDYLIRLSRIGGLSIVIILTITDEEVAELIPSSSWDKSCLPVVNQTTMKDAVDAILQVPNPSVNYTLSISLRLDIFHNASLPSRNSNHLRRQHVSSHKARSFSDVCERELFHGNSTSASISYVSQRNCAFASGADSGSVISLDTPATIRKKMFATYQWIKYPNTSTYVVGWTVYNVTRGLAPDKCLGPHNRIREIRKVIDENRYH